VKYTVKYRVTRTQAETRIKQGFQTQNQKQNVLILKNPAKKWIKKMKNCVSKYLHTYNHVEHLQSEDFRQHLTSNHKTDGHCTRPNDAIQIRMAMLG
jgi:hypothetical protein